MTPYVNYALKVQVNAVISTIQTETAVLVDRKKKMDSSIVYTKSKGQYANKSMAGNLEIAIDKNLVEQQQLNEVHMKLLDALEVLERLEKGNRLD